MNSEEIYVELDTMYIIPSDLTILALGYLKQNCIENLTNDIKNIQIDLKNIINTDIAGFQFDHDGCATGAGGGDAGAAGFMISASETIVLGFSLTGSVISAGAGTLVDLGSEDCTEASLTNFIFSDSIIALKSSG